MYEYFYYKNYNNIIIVYYAEAAENIKHTHTIHAYTIKQFKHTTTQIKTRTM